MNVTICVGSACHIKGSRKVVECFQELIEKNDLGPVIELNGSFCMGNCRRGVCVKVDGDLYSVSSENAENFFETEIKTKLS